MQTITKRLSRDTGYQKAEKTFQQSMTNEEISKKLMDYIKVENNSDVLKIPLNTHIRYFALNPKTGKLEFRLGGNLTKIGDNLEYVILSNGNFSWSVQLKNTIFYKKQNITEIKEQIENEVTTKMNEDMKILAKENKELKKIIKQIKETTLNSKNKKY